MTIPSLDDGGGGVDELPECVEWVERIEWEERRGIVVAPPP